MHIVRTIRVTLTEFNAINDATEALNSQRSTLVQEGVTEAAHKLGLYAGREMPLRPRRIRWTDAPERGDDSASMRFAVTYSPTLYPLLQRVAKLVDVSESLFAIGATLRYIATLQASHPENHGLQAVRLPPQYR